MVFENPIEAAQRVADILKNREKCDLVVCLSHLGWQGKPYSDETLIPNTRNIDIVLGGHSHSYLIRLCFIRIWMAKRFHCNKWEKCCLCRRNESKDGKELIVAVV